MLLEIGSVLIGPHIFNGENHIESYVQSSRSHGLGCFIPKTLWTPSDECDFLRELRFWKACNVESIYNFIKNVAVISILFINET